MVCLRFEPGSSRWKHLYQLFHSLTIRKHQQVCHSYYLHDSSTKCTTATTYTKAPTTLPQLLPTRQLHQVYHSYYLHDSSTKCTTATTYCPLLSLQPTFLPCPCEQAAREREFLSGSYDDNRWSAKSFLLKKQFQTEIAKRFWTLLA